MLALSRRALRVLDAIRAHARNGIVCETTGTLAAWLRSSTDTVRRGLDELLAAGVLEATPMRAGKAKAYRLVESPQVAAGSPQPALQESGAGAPVGGPPAPHQTSAARTASQLDDDDKRWLDGFIWTPELRREYALMAATNAARYGGTDLSEIERAGHGICADCFREDDVTERELLRFGQFDVCAAHALRRRRAGQVLTVERHVPGEREMPRPLLTVLPAGVRL